MIEKSEKNLIFIDYKSTMSKLLKAPLVEIILELRWKVTNKSDLTKIQYLHGDIYSLMKDKYPYRESVVPVEIPIEILINQPIHRFRSAANDYPLFQVGPGVLTLNTIDEKYFWDKFSEDLDELVDSFLKIFKLDENEKFAPSIIFIDFFSFDFDNNDVYEFINQKFNIKISQSFIELNGYPNDVNIGFHYETILGDLSVIFQKGKNSKQENGIVIQTKVSCKTINPAREDILDWFEKSHELCSDIFKKLTHGELYESFK